MLYYTFAFQMINFLFIIKVLSETEHKAFYKILFLWVYVSAGTLDTIIPVVTGFIGSNW
jgi:hypothetical protein